MVGSLRRQAKPGTDGTGNPASLGKARGGASASPLFSGQIDWAERSAQAEQTSRRVTFGGGVE
jgi:hypothetical protein